MIINDLTNYLLDLGFDEKETSTILNGQSIYQVIQYKIYVTLVYMQKYEKRIGNELVTEEKLKINLEEILKDKVDIENIILRSLVSGKNKMTQVDVNIKKKLISKLNVLINIIKNINNIEKTIKIK